MWLTGETHHFAKNGDEWKDQNETSSIPRSDFTHFMLTFTGLLPQAVIV
jgi:hypothetical protein